MKVSTRLLIETIVILLLLLTMVVLAIYWGSSG